MKRFVLTGVFAEIALLIVGLVWIGPRGGLPEPEQVPEPAALPAGPSGLRGGLPEFDLAAVTWNSYWYSRYNLGSLVMMSGLGVTFAPDMEAVRAMVEAVDRGPADGEHVVLPQNPALLQAVYAGGNPALAQPFNGDPSDLANFRWDPAGADTRITPSAMAQTIIKEVEWAKLFNNAAWAGRPTDAFGAMDRFKGVVLFAEAKMQVAFALAELRNADGLFVAAVRHQDGRTAVVDPTVGVGDQFQMLQALADVHTVLHHPERFNGVYRDETFHRLVAGAADELFRAIAGMEPQGIAELSLGAQALTWYASITHDAGLQQRALELLGGFGDGLLASAPGDVVDRARAVRGLIEAGRVLGQDRYLDQAGALFREMAAEYDRVSGYFESRTHLGVWEVGDILGALNALRAHGPEGIDQEEVNGILTGFFEAAVNRSGLIQAAPPKELEASPFELEAVGKDLFFAYPTVPTPDRAGGPFGRAPVDASGLRWDQAQGRWVVSDTNFDTAGAMHLSNEEIWIFGLVDGFPTVTLATG